MRRNHGNFPLAGAILGIAALVAFPSAGALAQTEVEFRLDWRPGAQHSPFYHGKAKGYYAAEGIDLKIISGSGSSDSVKQVGSKAVDIGLVDAMVMAQAVEQGVPVKAIAAYYQRSPISIMSPEAKPVKDPKQLLQGVRIGSKKGSATYQGLVAFLAANKIEQTQINLVDIGFGVQPLLVGQVDAMMAFTMNEPIQAEKAGIPIHEIMIADYGVHTYGLTLATNTTFMKEHGKLISGFLRATRRALADAAKDPGPVIDALAAALDGVDKDLERQVLVKVVPFWTSDATRGKGYGWQTEEGWRQTVTTAEKLGLVDRAPAASAMFTNAYQ